MTKYTLMLVIVLAFAANGLSAPPAPPAAQAEPKMERLGDVAPVIPPDLSAAIVQVETDKTTLNTAQQALATAQQALATAQQQLSSANAALNKDQAALDVIYKKHYPPVVPPTATTTTATASPKYPNGTARR